MKETDESKMILSKILTRIQSGETQTAIAKEIGLSLGQLRYRLKKHFEQQVSATVENLLNHSRVETFAIDSQIFNESWTRTWGVNRLTVLVQGPRTMYAYWEVNELRMRLICEHFQSDWAGLPFYLQVYDVSEIYFDGYNAHSSRLIRVNPYSDNWFINDIQPNRHYVVDFGTKASNGQFFTILRSSVVETPGERQEISPRPSIRFGTVHQNGSKSKSTVTKRKIPEPSHSEQVQTIPYESNFDGYHVTKPERDDG